MPAALYDGPSGSSQNVPGASIRGRRDRILAFAGLLTQEVRATKTDSDLWMIAKPNGATRRLHLTATPALDTAAVIAHRCSGCHHSMVTSLWPSASMRQRRAAMPSGQ